MLARRRMPSSYLEWNRRWHAPDGRSFAAMPRRLETALRSRAPQLFGPFAYQVNNSTRVFEYPWAWDVGRVREDHTVVEIGGGLGGLQFVAARTARRVLNVDPGEAAAGRGWPVDQARVQRLNRAFGTDVELIPRTLEEAHLDPASVDRVFCISTMEHIPPDELGGLAAALHRILAPGGRAVLTVDLFLDVAPFGTNAANKFGTNVDLWSFIQGSRLELEIGTPSEICGGPDFEPARVLDELPQLLIGDYPALVQAIVLRKP